MTLERAKQLAIAYRDPLYTSLLLFANIAALAITAGIVILIIWLIPAINEWRHANTASTVVYEGTVKNLGEAAEGLKSDLKEVGPALKGLQEVEVEAKNLIVATQKNTDAITVELNGRLRTLDKLILSVDGVAQEVRVQVKQNGDATALAVASLNDFVKHTDDSVIKLLNNGSVMIETANPKLQHVLDHMDSLIIDTDGTIKAYKPVGDNLSKATGSVAQMTEDSAKKWHDILFPPPVKGFWPNVKRVATYTYRPLFDGVNLYLRLTSLPIRITDPITVK